MRDAWENFKAGFTPSRRKLIYRVVSSFLLILSVNGMVTAEESAAYLEAVAYLLGIGVTEMAAANVSEE